MVSPLEPKVGMIVRHLSRADWDAGRVVATDDQCFHVFFPYDRLPTAQLAARKAKRFLLAQADRFELLEGHSDALLANLPAFARDGQDYVLPEHGLSLESARAKFLELFPGGFAGDAYFGDRKRGERAYKLRAHELFVTQLGEGQLEALLTAGDIVEAARRAKSVVGAVNLLHAIESAAFGDALADEQAALQYLSALSRLLAATTINAAAFEDYLASFLSLPRERAGNVHSWVVCTALPFLAQPLRFMHLKPSETLVAAARLGFDLRYESRPNWTTYDRLLVFADWLRSKLADLGCRDMIDVQSFIFATCGGYDQKPQKKAKSAKQD